jgi:3-oxosteroid 1-dehydrogenase
MDNTGRTQLDNVDVVVVGSGLGGMVAALTAHHQGLRCVVIEKTAFYGGSSALSGGNLWVPNNPVNRRAKLPDSMDDARAYLDAIVGDSAPRIRREAFLSAGPDALEFLEANTPWFRYQRVDGYSDYHPEEPGGRPTGRSIEPTPLDARLLGDDAAQLNRDDVMHPPGGIWITTADYHHLMLVARTWRAKAHAVRIGVRSWFGRALGRRMLTLGAAGVAQLRLALRDAGIPVLLNTALRDLVVEDRQVVGVLVAHDGVESTLRAERGVVLAAGGFEHNDAMRKTYQQAPIGTEWTAGAAGNTGDAIVAAQRLGAATALMERAWWGPSILAADGAYFILSERSLPGSIMVNGAGRRFVNEAAPYVNAVDAMYAGEATGVSHVPSYLILDQRFRNRYAMIATPPRRRLPKEWIEDGTVVVANDLRELATRLAIPADALVASVERFNGFARRGKDDEFGRGESAYDRYYGDPTVSPNPNLAAIDKPPYYAFRIVPGDLGTNGGLVCDELGRVQRDDGEPIPGLYAIGNCSAAVMGNEYAGPGATLGPAVVYGYIAARHIADPAYHPVARPTRQ